jgi:hypothetical protein
MEPDRLAPVAPLAPFYLAAPGLGLFALVSGAVVAAATHALMRIRTDEP